jgi:DNA-binding response OmpR family regulator
LYDDLVKHSTPFFLYLPEYNKEDIVVGLEMGIDSFIISPFDEGTLTKKVNHHLNKAKNSKIIETDEFKTLFETTPVAKFISEQDKIINTNKAFEKLTGISGRTGIFSKIEDIFVFNTDVSNQYFGSDYSDKIKLTPREKEVMEWSAQGLPIKQI